ncbi:MFS transporter [Promicromonospora iranensis]|uniref:MFS family permease n=1 Tax=Promicromonospora iranensis TaxID=1105144 RepID=A0ABU2CM89_9MICO|nr:MFS transporter [Promicromonospora iranensis]MDR7382428.1 MFS family permease [Promicromonospora iranensis]
MTTERAAGEARAGEPAAEPAAEGAAGVPEPATSLWGNRSYRLLLTGTTAEDVGDAIGTLAVPLLAYAVTGSVVQAGLIVFVGRLGSMVMALPAGVVVDRVNRRRLIIAGAAVAAAAWLSVVLVGLVGGLSVTGPHLAGVLFVSSVVGSLMDPAGTAALHAVVPKEQLGQALSVAQGRDAAATLLSGPLGGLLYGVSSVLPFLVSAAGRLVAVVTTSMVREPLNGDLASARAERPLASLGQGLRLVFGVRLFRSVLGLFILVNVVVNGLMIAINLHLVRSGTDPTLVGLVYTAVGVGVLAGSVVAGPLIRRVRVGALTAMALGASAVAVIVMALFPTYWGFVAALTGMMLFAPALNAGVLSYVTAITPGHMQGRMSATLGLTGLVAGPVAPLAGSLLLAGLGIAAAMWVFAASLVVLFLALFLVRSLWRVGLPDTWAADVIEWPTARPPSAT